MATATRLPASTDARQSEMVNLWWVRKARFGLSCKVQNVMLSRNGVQFITIVLVIRSCALIMHLHQRHGVHGAGIVGLDFWSTLSAVIKGIGAFAAPVRAVTTGALVKSTGKVPQFPFLVGNGNSIIINKYLSAVVNRVNTCGKDDAHHSYILPPQ